MTEEVKDEIILEAKRLEEDCLYSANGHFAASRSWARTNLIIGIATAILSTIAAALAFADISNLIVAGLAVIVTALAWITVVLNPGDKAAAHHNSGSGYNALRSRVRFFSNVDSKGAVSDDELIRVFNELSRHREELNSNAPQVSEKDYETAKRGIQMGQASYVVDKTQGLPPSQGTSTN
jgi:hypothetical protein